MPKILIGAIWMFLPLFSPGDTSAVVVASQTEVYSDPFYTWQIIQELGNNLSGTISSFTFRVSTSNTNLHQFDFTAQNTRIFDKDNNNSYITGCIPSGANPADSLRGLSFNTSGVPPGFEDVTIDFSCRNYDFIPGHRYLIIITNANISYFGGGAIRFAAASYNGTSNDYFSGGGLRYANGNPWDYYYGGGSCNPVTYRWNDQTKNPVSGCNIWSTAKDDLYFVLTNNAPPPRLPVIFIPGIGGSEMKASQDIVWSAVDGHGGTYSHAYSGNEKIWVNQDEAAKLGNDDYFDVLRLKTDGITPEANLSLTGNLTPFGYSDIDSFFTGMGYVKDTNYFIFPYDWRKDVRSTKDSLDALIETARQKSGQPKVNLVVHSMGGLVARYYISDSNKASKVNKLIELGVPHLGAVDSLKIIMYGKALGRPIFGNFVLGVAASEIKDVSLNLPSAFQLLPSTKYFNIYNNSSADAPYPFRDDRDIDNNKVTSSLNFDQTKSLLFNLNINMTIFALAEQLHNTLDSILNQTNGVKTYAIVGTAQPTLGQIHETWWITWPIDLIPKTDEIYINGDDTVPLYSASLKSDALDLSGTTKIYYAEQKHADLVSGNGIAMQTVKAILNDDNSLPVEVKDQKIYLEGQQISLDDGELDLYDDQNRHCGLKDNGEMEENIPEVTCTISGTTKHAFVKKKADKVKIKTTRKTPANSSKTTNLKKKTYKQDKIVKTTIYKDIKIPQAGKVEFTLDPTLDTNPVLTFYADSAKTESTTLDPTSEATGSAALDQTSPTTSIQISGTEDSNGIYTNPVIVTLTGSDAESGMLKIEYSVDNGQTVQTYTGPFIISTPGKTAIQFKSIDKLGNEEIPQVIIIEIATLPTPSPSPTPDPSLLSASVLTTTASATSSPTPTPTSTPIPSPSPTPTSTPIPSPSPTVIPTPAPAVTPTPISTSVPVTNSFLNNQNTQPVQLLSLPPSPSPAILGASSNGRPQILNNQQKPTIIKEDNPTHQNFTWLLIIFGGIITLGSLGLMTASIKKVPRKM